MKSLIIYSSLHHGNTRKVAEKMALELKADLFTAREFLGKSFEGYSLIGLGSGIYNRRFNQDIIKIAESLYGKNVFLFSTSGSGNERYNTKIEKSLLERGCRVLGSFACKGYDTYGVFKYIGGISKTHPNYEDFEEATEFARNLDENRPKQRYFFL